MFEAQNGAAAPAGNPGEQGNPAAAQPNAATTPAQTGGAEGGEQSQITPKTYTEEELRDRLERATAKASAKAERRAFREALAHLSQTQSQQPAQQPAQNNDGKPTRAQYANDEAFVDALTDWKLEQRERKAEQQREQEQHRTLAQKTETIYSEAEKLDGFDREAFDDLPLTKPMVEALIDSDAPAKLMHFMAANPADVERISKLSPARQAAELGKLEAKATAAPVKPSKAPDPIRPIGSRGAPSSTSLPSDEDDIATWMQKEAKRVRGG